MNLGPGLGPQISGQLGSQAAPTASAFSTQYAANNNPWSQELAADNSQLAQDQSAMTSLFGQLDSGENAMNQSSANYLNQMPQMESTLGNLNNAASAYGTASAPTTTNNYPSFPNIAGAGSQTAGQVTGTPQQAQQTSSAMPTSPTYGFSPWSLQGEANVR